MRRGRGEFEGGRGGRGGRGGGSFRGRARHHAPVPARNARIPLASNFFEHEATAELNIEFQSADGTSSAVEEHLSSTRRFWLLKGALVACGYLPEGTKVDNSRYAVHGDTMFTAEPLAGDTGVGSVVEIRFEQRPFKSDPRKPAVPVLVKARRVEGRASDDKTQEAIEQEINIQNCSALRSLARADGGAKYRHLRDQVISNSDSQVINGDQASVELRPSMRVASHVITTAAGQRVLSVATPKFACLSTQTVAEQISDMQGRGASQEEINTELANCRVCTVHTNDTYCVLSVDFDHSPATQKFQMRRRDAEGKLVLGEDGECVEDEMSVAEYTQTRYGVTVPNANTQPMLVVCKGNQDPRRVKKAYERSHDFQPIFLIPSMCRVVGMTGAVQRDAGIRRNMVRCTQQEPRQLLARASDFMRELQSVSTTRVRPVNVTGVYLGPSQVMSDPSHAVPFRDEAQAELNAREIGQVENWGAGVRDNWMLVHGDSFSRDVRRTIGEDLVGTVLGRTLGVTLGPPRHVVSMSRADEANDTAWHDAVHRAFAQAASAGDAPRFLLVVLPPRNTDNVYAAVKHLAFNGDVPVPSQCMQQPRPGDKGLLSKLTKIGVQLCAKMNGRVYVAPQLQTLMAGFGDGPYMVAGVDEEGGIASMVFSLTDMVDQFAAVYAHVPSKGGRGPLPIRQLLSQAIATFARANKMPPKNVLLLRAGASTGRVVRHVAADDARGKELETMEAEQALKDAGVPDARLAYVLVNASPDARFAFEGSNVLPGTMVSGEVCKPNEFYLVANATRAGTARPIRCSIVHASNVAHSMQEMLQPIAEIVNAMCMLFYNWSGAVRLPAPLLGARKAAEMVARIANKDTELLVTRAADTAPDQLPEVCLKLGQIYL